MEIQRQDIRSEVAHNIKQNAEYMVKKHATSKKKIIDEFSIGDNVVVYVSKKEKADSNTKNIPCVIIDKSSGMQPNYKLLCKYGVINKRVPGSKLRLFPGDVQCEPPHLKISLREASRKYSSTSIFCHCKKSCSNSQCKCYNSSIKCSSRCHKTGTKHCKNKFSNENIVNQLPDCSYQSSSSSLLPTPHYGGSRVQDGIMYSFFNTCAIDTWLTVLKCIQIGFSSVFNDIENPQTLQHLLNLVCINAFCEAKFMIANFHNIPAKENQFDFYGNEFTLILAPFINHLLRYTCASHCSNPLCPVKNKTDSSQSTSIPVLRFEDSSNLISPAEFVFQLSNWFVESSETVCGDRRNDDRPQIYNYCDTNMLTGLVLFMVLSC